MDNNLPTNPTNQTSQGQVPSQSAPTETLPPMAQQPQMQATPPPITPPVKSSSKNMLLIILIFVLVVMLGVLAYLLFTKRQREIPPGPRVSPVPTAIPTPMTEEELNSIDVGNVDEDLKEIDTDLQLL